MNFAPSPALIENKVTFNVRDFIDDVVIATLRSNASLQDIEIITQKTGSPYFAFGTELEIATMLSLKQNKANEKFLRFPLIAMIVDENTQKVEMFPDANTFFNANIRIYFIMDCKSVDSTDYKLDNIFIPTLYPLYSLFIDALKSNVKYFNVDRFEELFIGYERIDHFTLNIKDNKNVFNQTACGIELPNLKLSFNKNYCLNN